MLGGTIRGVMPSLDEAVAVGGKDVWIVPRQNRGQFIPGPKQPELREAKAGTVKNLPVEDEVIYFIVGETDKKVAKLWATKQEYADVAAIMLQEKELDRQRAELEAYHKDLTDHPRIRYMEQLIRKGVVVGEPTVINPPGEVLLEIFLRTNPFIRLHDKFTTTGDFWEKRDRWPETLTPNGWLKMEKDPRRKT